LRFQSNVFIQAFCVGFKSIVAGLTHLTIYEPIYITAMILLLRRTLILQECCWALMQAPVFDVPYLNSKGLKGLLELAKYHHRQLQRLLCYKTISCIK